MSELTLKGNTIHTNGELPKEKSIAPDFVLIDASLKECSLKDYKGKTKILSIVPSLDTDVCLSSAKIFNERASSLNDVVILYISADLPFAAGRVCGAENLTNIQALSIMRDKKFALDYGVLIKDGPLAGLCARAVVVLDKENHVVYRELVPEITQEPNYDTALESVRNLL